MSYDRILPFFQFYRTTITWNNEVYTQSGTYQQNFMTTEECDSIVTLHLMIHQSAANEFTATACDEYVWNNSTYTESGIYQQHFTTAHQCDSTVTLHLTIYPSATGEFSATACDEYVWNEVVYTQSGDYEQRLVTASPTHCDSIVTLHLTIHPSQATEFTVEACEQYTWNNEVYTQSGTYQQNFMTTEECDSIVTLHLTIHQPVANEFTATACDEYVWNNSTYTESGTYQQHFTTAHQCDSTVTLHLTIYPSATNEFSATACDEYVWNEVVYTHSGDYEQRFVTASPTHCDSIVTLHLTIHPSQATEFSVEACEQYTWNNEVYTQSGTYQQNFMSTEECDSIVTLHLTIHQPVANEFIATACDEYVWNNSTYTESGTYQQHFTTAHQCDSTVTLQLTINHSITSNFSATACDEYVWNEVVYTQSGSYVQHFTPTLPAYCDSIVTLQLTIHPSATTPLTAAICEGESYTENGFSLLTPAVGNHADTLFLTSAAGCDSTVILSLTVNPLPTIIITGDTLIQQGEIATLTATSTDEGMTWLWSEGSTTNSITVTPEATTDYSVTGVNAAGCAQTASITVNVGMGISEQSATTPRLSMYPNPARNQIIVEMLNGSADIEQIQIYDITGKMFCQRTMSGVERVEMTVDNLVSGTYFVKITTPTFSTIEKLVIIR